MRSNEHYCTFPADSGNQTNRNVPSIEINLRSSVIHFSFSFRRQLTQTALLRIMFAGCQLEQNAKEKVQQYVNEEVDIIL